MFPSIPLIPWKKEELETRPVKIWRDFLFSPEGSRKMTFGPGAPSCPFGPGGPGEPFMEEHTGWRDLFSIEILFCFGFFFLCSCNEPVLQGVQRLLFLLEHQLDP